jgi:hypothetical protein
MAINSTIMLAMAFTFSCSSDDDDENPSPSNGGGSSSSGGNSGFDMSGLPTQVYLDGVEYTGNSDIMLVLRELDENGNRLSSDTIFAGKIQGGKITLNLPENIDSKYLEISFNDLRLYQARFRTIINGKIYALLLEAESVTQEGTGVYFIYSSKSGEVKETDYEQTYDMNISKGWNVTWGTGGNSSYLLSTNRPQAVGELKWIAED